MDSYAERDSLSTPTEKLMAVHIYLLRKLFLGVALMLSGTAEIVCKWFGFEYRLEVSDRDSWKWDLKEKLPVYRARVEKVD